MRHISKTSPAFTVVELVVGMTIAAFMMVGLFLLIITVVNSGSRSIEMSKQVNEAQKAANLIRDDLKLTSSFLATSDITDTRPGGGNWDFRGSSETNRVLVLRTLATDLYKTNAAREAVYLQSGGCPIGASPAFNNIVYFVRSGNLYRRIIVQPPVANLYCAGQTNGQKRTCESPGNPSAPSNCQEHDVLLTQNVTEFRIQYYDQPADISPDSTAYNPATHPTDPGSPTAAPTIKIILETNKQIGGDDNEYTTQFRATRTGSN